MDASGSGFVLMPRLRPRRADDDRRFEFEAPLAHWRRVATPDSVGQGASASVSRHELMALVDSLPQMGPAARLRGALALDVTSGTEVAAEWLSATAAGFVPNDDDALLEVRAVLDGLDDPSVRAFLANNRPLLRTVAQACAADDRTADSEFAGLRDRLTRLGVAEPSGRAEPSGMAGAVAGPGHARTAPGAWPIRMPGVGGAPAARALNVRRA